MVDIEIFSSMRTRWGDKDVIGFGIDGAAFTFVRGSMAIHHIGGAGPSSCRSMQIYPLVGAYGKGATDSLRRAWDCMGYGRSKAKPPSSFGRLPSPNGSWLDRQVDGGDGSLLFSSTVILRVSRFAGR